MIDRHVALFARARFADERDGAPAADGEAHVVDGGDHAVARVDSQVVRCSTRSRSSMLTSATRASG